MKQDKNGPFDYIKIFYHVLKRSLVYLFQIGPMMQTPSNIELYV
jgi:hypothetical protein